MTKSNHITKPIPDVEKKGNYYIGIFQAEWEVQIHTLNTALILANAGYNVDIFVYKTAFISELDLIKDVKNIQLYTWAICVMPGEKNNVEVFGSYDQKIKILTEKIIQNIRDLVRFRTRLNNLYEYALLMTHKYNNLIPSKISNEVAKIIKGKSYKCVIGVEKLGLVWANNISQTHDIPLIYHSLELYNINHPYCNTSYRNRRIKIAEATCHSNAIATIIQDERRGKVLLEYNNLEKTNFLYLPISVLTETKNNTHQDNINLARKINLSEKQTIILQFGKLERYGVELARIAQKFPDNWKLVLHDGLAIDYCNKNDIIQEIKTEDINNKIVLSLKKLNSQQINALVNTATIGLVFYPNIDMNNRLTSFSSEKIALYLKAGIPIIGFDYDGYEILVNNKCGLVIKNIEELPQAINEIISDYNNFKKNATIMYNKYYDFEKNFDIVLDFINKLG